MKRKARKTVKGKAKKPQKKAAAKRIKVSYKCSSCNEVVAIDGVPKKCPGCGKTVYALPDGACPLCGAVIITTTGATGIDQVPKRCPAQCCGQDLSGYDLDNGRCPFCGAGVICPTCGYDFTSPSR